MCDVITKYGTFVPQYEENNVRHKYTKSLSFYQNGNIKSIALNEQSDVKTKIGTFPAELITFYENGTIKRLFPLNGKITGYWTEENEYELAEEFTFTFAFGTFTKKIISLQFYESEDIKSITFWPKNTVKIETPIGGISVRVGLALYQSGMLKSVEPSKPTPIDTPIGVINAYDPNVIGISGDTNSLNFYEDGKLKSLVTSVNIIEVTNQNGEKSMFKPKLKPNLFDNEVMDIVPLAVEFYEDKVKINNSIENEYEINKYSFEIRKFYTNVKKSCSNCASCTSCG